MSVPLYDWFMFGNDVSVWSVSGRDTSVNQCDNTQPFQVLVDVKYHFKRLAGTQSHHSLTKQIQYLIVSVYCTSLSSISHNGYVHLLLKIALF